MNKKISIIISGCILMLIMAACSDASSESLQPERTPEIIGRVKSIRGNIIVLQEMAADSMGQQQRGQQGLSEEERAARKEERQNINQQERQDFDGEAEQMEEGQQAEERLHQEAQKQSQYLSQGFTGEKITVVIPVGVPITTRSGRSSQEGEVQVELSNIITGVNLMIWTQDEPGSGEVTAEYVRITSVRE